MFELYVRYRTMRTRLLDDRWIDDAAFLDGPYRRWEVPKNPEDWNLFCKGPCAGLPHPPADNYSAMWGGD